MCADSFLYLRLSKYIVFFYSPLNMLDNYENRYGYAAVVGLTAASCLSSTLGSYSYVIGYQNAEKIDELPSYLSSKTFSQVISCSVFECIFQLLVHIFLFSSLTC